MAKDKKLRICSFCGLPESSERRIIEGDNAYICDFCVDVCHQMFDLSRRYEEEAASIPRTDLALGLTPRTIYEKLCEYVIGQERAKRSCRSRFTIIISASKTIYMKKATSK